MPDNTGQVQEEYVSKLSQLESKIAGDTFVQTFSKNCEVLKSMCGMALVYENRMKQYTKEIKAILLDLKQAGGFRLEYSLIGASCCCQCHEAADDDETRPNGQSAKRETTDVETQTELQQSTDFLPPQGSQMTVGDMVTQAAQEMCPGGANGDYVYNEQYQMYFSQSTGYYWDPKTKLFFQATTGTYFKYEEETQSYTVVDPPSISKDKERRRKSRSRDRRRRRSRSRSRSRDRDRRRRRSRSKQKRSVSRSRKDRERSHSRDDRRRSTSRKRRRTHSLDEGELLSDDGSIEMAILSEDEGPKPVTTSYPPCIRFVVKKSQKLQINSVQILPFPGGVLGAPLKSDLCVPDQGIGKRHCNVYFEADSQQYKLEQLDGNNSTRVNGKVIKKGDKHDLIHMDRFEFGEETLLEAHVHDNGETCGNCEPGLLQRRAEEDAPVSNAAGKSVNSETQRRKNLKDLKKQYGLADDAYTEPRVDTQQYADRAGERRTKVGSDFPHERDAAPSDVNTPVEQTNRGFKMLQGMGWKEGEGLGRSKQGETEPVLIQMRNERAGLGNEDSNRTDEKGDRWRKARARYSNIR